MIFFFELLMLLCTLGLIFYPLYSRKFAGVDGEELTESEMSDLLYKKEASYIALKDLEFDYRTSKISDEDYKSMKTQFEAEAMESLRMIDAYKTGDDKAPVAVKDTKHKKSKGQFCHECGKQVANNHKFCSNCGTVI